MLRKAALGLARRLMQPINPSLVALLGGYTFLWGLWLLSPWWHVFERAPLYSKMAVFPEWVWGAVAVYSGLELLRGVIRSKNKDLRRGAFIGYIHWLVITFMYFWGDWHNTGGITSMTVSLYCFVIYLNYRRNKDFPPG